MNEAAPGAGAFDARALARVCVTDRRTVIRGDVAVAVARAVQSLGATLVVLRESDLPRDELLSLARAVRAATPREVPILLSRDPIAAYEAGLDGVQLGWNSPSAFEARRILGARAWIGRSVHESSEARAEKDVDFLVFGPVFPTPKPFAQRPPHGLEGLRAFCSAADRPVVAIGGLGFSDERAARAAGAAGFAAIRAFMPP